MKNHGFTLIECLVALLIIAIILASSTRAISLAIEDVKSSYTRELASWVGTNAYYQFYINYTYPNLGHSETTINMAGIDFIVNSFVSGSGNPFFRKIDISVSEKRNPNYIIYHTVNFISEF